MSAVLAITDRRSALFQILFAVFDSLEGFIIVMVHCILRREVSTLTIEAGVRLTFLSMPELINMRVSGPGGSEVPCCGPQRRRER